MQGGQELGERGRNSIPDRKVSATPEKGKNLSLELKGSQCGWSLLRLDLLQGVVDGPRVRSLGIDLKTRAVYGGNNEKVECCAPSTTWK